MCDHVISDKKLTKSIVRLGIGYTEVAGNISCLQEGFEQLGSIDYRLYILSPSKYQYIESRRDRFSSFHLFLVSTFRKVIKSNVALKIFWELLLPIRVLIFIHQLFHVNTLYLLSGHSLFPLNLDYLIWHLIPGKILVSSFHGSDCRPPFLNGKFIHKKMKITRLLLATLNRFFILKRVEAFSDVIINTPPQALWMKKKFINQLKIGKPYSKYIYHDNTVHRHVKFPLKISHIPSSVATKGTSHIRLIISQLYDEIPGKFLYQEFTNLKHEDCLKKIQESDILIDQLYSDLPCPSISKECYALGTVPLVGGYFSEYMHESFFNLTKEEIKLLLNFNFVPPSEMKSLIKDCILNYGKYKSRLLDNRVLMQSNWSSMKIAEYVVSLISACQDKNIHEMHSASMFNPTLNNYFLGCGLSYDEISMVKASIQKSPVRLILNLISREILAPLERLK